MTDYIAFSQITNHIHNDKTYKEGGRVFFSYFLIEFAERKGTQPPER